MDEVIVLLLLVGIVGMFLGVACEICDAIGRAIDRDRDGQN